MIQLIHQEEVVSMSYWKEITKNYKYEMMPTRKHEVEVYRTINTCKDLFSSWEKEKTHMKKVDGV